MKNPAPPSRKPKATDDDVARVLQLLQANRGVHLKREEIAEVTGINERIVRDAIARLVACDAAAVIPDRQDGGYTLCEDPVQIFAEVGRLQSQIDNTLRRIDALKRMGIEFVRISAGLGSGPAATGTMS